MRLIGLTGGIGSGKSSVSSRLGDRGARIIDADAIVKELQSPGQPVFLAMVDRWGSGIVTDEGELDRAAVADLVFGDDDELRALEALVHPEVRREMDRRVAEAAPSDDIVVLDIPLLAESRKPGGKGPDGRGTSAIIVVDCPVETAIARLVEHRGFTEDAARARMAKQVAREERLALADFVIDNGGTPEQLDDEVARCWAWLEALPPTQWPPTEWPPPDQGD